MSAWDTSIVLAAPETDRLRFAGPASAPETHVMQFSDVVRWVQSIGSTETYPMLCGAQLRPGWAGISAREGDLCVDCGKQVRVTRL